MIETERGNDRYLGRQDVGGIEPAAQPHLDDGDVHLGAAKVQKADGSDGLKVGHTGRAFNRRADLLHQCGDLVPRDLVPIHLDALAEGVHVGRGVKAGTVAGGPQARCAHGCRRTLALGAGDVHRREAGMRVAHSRQQPLDPREIERLGRITLKARLFVIRQTVEIGDSLCVIHRL